MARLRLTIVVVSQPISSPVLWIENSPDGNVGADDDGDNDKYNQQQTVNDRKSIQEADELLAIIKGIRI